MVLTRGLEPLEAAGANKRGRLRNARVKSDSARSAIQRRLSFIQILKGFSVNEWLSLVVERCGERARCSDQKRAGHRQKRQAGTDVDYGRNRRISYDLSPMLL
jgi:hypothetical protein